jgi:hypothetical protein
MREHMGETSLLRSYLECVRGINGVSLCMHLSRKSAQWPDV